MCSVKTPKPPTTPANQQKPPVYMRNAYLDGLGINSENAGRNSLRIDRGGRAPRPPRPVNRPVVPPTTSIPPPIFGNPGPGMGIGGAGGLRGGGLGLGIRLF